mmetsp:Transcript_14498/g.29944  ORF Transcript_14498/g.29944 Transcript_14498/m.29944 type:complete len:107 (-) Transcript_14498:46-366(-)
MTSSTESKPTKMQQALHQQDASLDELSAGMDRLKNTTQAIHEEATEQTRLLGGMEGEADEAQSELDADIALTQARIKEDKSVWKLQLIVVALSALLVLILFQGLFG